MPRKSAEERAWGFTEKEYVAAFSHVEPREDAEREFAELFRTLNADPEANIGGDDLLFAILSLASESARERVQAITGWSNEELATRVTAALNSPLGLDKQENI